VEITRVVIRNFRSIKEAEIVFHPVTVFIGPNNIGKTAILEALRIALSRRWGQRGTGFKPHDVHLPPGITDPKQAPPIDIIIEFEERTSGEWPQEVQNALDDIAQLNPVTGHSIIILNVTCPMDPATGGPEPKWQFLNLQRQPLTGKGARNINLVEFFLYVPIFYLSPLRDADDEFSARSQFWGRLLKAMQIPDTLKDKLKTDLDQLNKDLLAADPRMTSVTDNLKRIAAVLPAGTPSDLQLRALPMEAWEMMGKTEVVYKADGNRPWLPLTNHGQGIQSLAVIFLFDAFVKHLLAELYKPESTPVLQLEEPETHLHPQAVKSLCSTLLKISGQKIITTHSPYFVQNVPFRDLRIVRLTDQGTSVAWLPATFRTTIPHVAALDTITTQYAAILQYDMGSATLTAKGYIDDDLYRRLLKAYSTHQDAASIVAKIKDLRQRTVVHITDEDLAKLETWARRVRGEIFFASKWLIVEGQSDYLIFHTIAALMGQACDDHGISIIDAMNSGNPGTFAALARALCIPWAALFDGDDAGKGYLKEIENRRFTQTEITARCTLLPQRDMEAQLVNDGFEQELRVILQRLGAADGDTITNDELAERLRGKKMEYSIGLCEELRENPALINKVPQVIKDKITQLRDLTV
jgi:putative ATP-dependent endonuclease of the OLD family